MYMDGFRSGSGSLVPCVVFLFDGWAITSRGELAAACIGTVFVGLLAQAIVGVRPVARARLAQLSRPACVVAEVFLFASQVLLGYLLMLIAMTYQVELLVSVVLGLAAGHGLLVVLTLRDDGKLPVEGNAEPCCDMDYGGRDVSATAVEPIKEAPCCGAGNTDATAPPPGVEDGNLTSGSSSV